MIWCDIILLGITNFSCHLHTDEAAPVLDYKAHHGGMWESGGIVPCILMFNTVHTVEECGTVAVS